MPHSSEQMFQMYPGISYGQASVGDLVFTGFGEFSPGLPGHVGLYIGNGQVIDAPHTGSFVQVELLQPWIDGGRTTFARVPV
jgi:cell wall-associated NlpC family hydrolase